MVRETNEKKLELARRLARDLAHCVDNHTDARNAAADDGKMTVTIRSADYTDDPALFTKAYTLFSRNFNMELQLLLRQHFSDPEFSRRGAQSQRPEVALSFDGTTVTLSFAKNERTHISARSLVSLALGTVINPPASRRKFKSLGKKSTAIIDSVTKEDALALISSIINLETGAFIDPNCVHKHTLNYKDQRAQETHAYSVETTNVGHNTQKTLEALSDAFKKAYHENWPRRSSTHRPDINGEAVVEDPEHAVFLKVFLTNIHKNSLAAWTLIPAQRWQHEDVPHLPGKSEERDKISLCADSADSLKKVLTYVANQLRKDIDLAPEKGQRR
jgi:hypothetical protein